MESRLVHDNAMPNDRALLWQELHALWEKHIPAAELLPMLLHYIALTEAKEGGKAKQLIVPLRWMGLLCHQLKKYEQERDALDEVARLGFGNAAFEPAKWKCRTCASLLARAALHQLPRRR